MITRSELRRIPQLHKDIRRKKAQLAYLREKATAIPSTLPDHERVQTSPSGSGNRYVEEAVDLGKEIEADEEGLKQLKSKAAAFIRTLPARTETEKLTVKIMRKRYIKGYTYRFHI